MAPDNIQVPPRDPRSSSGTMSSPMTSLSGPPSASTVGTSPAMTFTTFSDVAPPDSSKHRRNTSSAQESSLSMEPEQNGGSTMAAQDQASESSSGPKFDTVDRLAGRTDYANDPENDIRNNNVKAPWNFVGYRIFSKWIATDDAFLILRRFGELNARVALALQDEIVELEQELESREKAVWGNEMGRDDWDNGTLRNDPMKRRQELVRDVLPEKLIKYNTFINSYSQLLDRPRFHEDDFQCVKKWLETNSGAIDPPEAQFIAKKDDLFGVKPKVRSWFRNVLESSFLLTSARLKRNFERDPQDKAELARHTFDNTVWPDDDKVESFSTLVISFVGLVMLVGPLWILAFVQNIASRLGIITSFVAIFFVLVAVATKCGIFNALAAAAAYSAVLMVFIQVSAGGDTSQIP